MTKQIDHTANLHRARERFVEDRRQLAADIEGFDYREIAQTTEVPIGTVMSRSGRRRLTETLSGKSHD
jgi:DNA-directed RNA polymerase specialized sigma24 family protein